jgi:amidohydrolase
VVFLFQPAEEGPSDFTPEGNRFWGARQMVTEGALENPKVNAVFGLHVYSGIPTGKVQWRAGPALASGDRFSIRVSGRGTHGGTPWRGVDPVVLSAQVVLGIQTIESRQMEVTKEPSVITIGQIHGGTRENIVPDAVDMEGTIRTYDRAMQLDIYDRIRRTAQMIAQSGNGKADVDIVEMYQPTVNDPTLTQRMGPTLKRVAGPDRIGGFLLLSRESPGPVRTVGRDAAGQAQGCAGQPLASVLRRRRGFDSRRAGDV